VRGGVRNREEKQSRSITGDVLKSRLTISLETDRNRTMEEDGNTELRGGGGAAASIGKDPY